MRRAGTAPVQTYRATTGADARAKQLAAARDEQVPKLREQIDEIESQIAELEHAPLVAEQQARQHIEAGKTIRSSAPAFVRARFKAVDALRIHPTREKLSSMLGELGKLRGHLTIDPACSDHRHVFESTRDRNGDAPWLLTDMHGRTIIDPQAWRRFIVEEDVQSRHDALASEVESLSREIQTAEIKVNATLDYWLHLADDQPGESA